MNKKELTIEEIEFLTENLTNYQNKLVILKGKDPRDYVTIPNSLFIHKSTNKREPNAVVLRCYHNGLLCKELYSDDEAIILYNDLKLKDLIEIKRYLAHSIKISHGDEVNNLTKKYIGKFLIKKDFIINKINHPKESHEVEYTLARKKDNKIVMSLYYNQFSGNSRGYIDTYIIKPLVNLDNICLYLTPDVSDLESNAYDWFYDMLYVLYPEDEEKLDLFFESGWPCGGLFE